MQKFKYVATDKEGKKIKGNFVAENENEMKEMLLKAGYYVTSFRTISSVDYSRFFSISGKIKTKELSQFCNQFSAMISAGVSIVEAIDVSASQSYSSLLKTHLIKIKEDLKQGLLLSQAMQKYPKVFPTFFSSMVFVGESAGCLDKVLVSVAEYYELEEKTKKKIKGALAYPIVLLLMLVVVVVAMMLFVVPTFIDSLSKMDVEMPALTMAIFNASIFFKEYGLILLAFIAVFIILLWVLSFLPSVKLFYDRLKVTLPVFKKINIAVFTSRFCRSLGLLLASGADSLEALESMDKTITNKYLNMQFKRVIRDVKMGMSLSAALTAEMQVSEILTQMIIVGEKTGELDVVLEKTAPYFDRETEQTLGLITTIVQPAVMILLGVVVAVLFIAIYSPILSMITSLDTSGAGTDITAI